MVVEYKVNNEEAYIEVIATQTLRTDEVIEYITALDQDKSVKPGFVELFDVTRMKDSEIAEKLKTSKIWRGGTKLAIVVSRSSSFERAKYLVCKLSESHNVIVFNRRSTAEIW
jgi:hypothetical protein